MTDHHPDAETVLAMSRAQTGRRPTPDAIDRRGAAAALDALTAAGLAVVRVGDVPPWMERLAPTFPETECGQFGWFCREDDSIFWADDHDGIGEIAERLYVVMDTP